MPRENGTDSPTKVGVIGVGSMGRHHARIYSQLCGVDLVGVVDSDFSMAASVAEEFETRPRSQRELLATADAVSVAVPTAYHFDIARKCLEAGVHVLVEKPFVETIEQGEKLIDLAAERDLRLQVGHVERFNPAVETLADITQDLDLLAVDVARLGPPREREIADSAVLDLMIHDLDIVLSLLGESPRSVTAAGVRENEHAAVTLEFDSDVVATLRTSRLTQRKVRVIDVTAEDCLVHVDLMDRSIDIHRHSLPEFIGAEEGVRYRHESIVERPMVGNGEPLRHELRSFVDAVTAGTEPVVTGEDGLRALELAKEIERKSLGSSRTAVEVSHD